jgi:hypothetical protein
MKQLLTAGLLVLLFVGCKKDEPEDHSASSVNFTSIRQYDVHADYLGSQGDAGDDYKQEDWPDWVFDLFTPLDSVDLTGYVESPVTVDRLYPNPCGNQQTMRHFATQPVNLKVVIIDELKNVYFLNSVHLNSTIHNLAFDYTDAMMPGGKYYRMFYGFSAENKPFFSRGHIDIYKQ